MIQPILRLPDFNKVFQVDYDDSGTVIRVVWARLVAYFSEKLNDAKRKYFIYDHKFML